MATSPLTAEDLLTRVQAALDRWLARAEHQLAGVDPDCTGLTDAVADLLQGGKRLRAGFCYWAWRGAGGPADADVIVEAAAALELLQASALIHDDLIDHSDTRRGRPASHRRLEGEHRTRGWLGDSTDFGASAAILAGDLCLTGSSAVLHAAVAGLADDRRAAGERVYADMMTQLMAGQYLDVLVGLRPDADDPVEQARRVIRYKTVNYTVARPLQLGGTLAGAGPDTLDAYNRYAGALGEAFQLRDDVLGVFGDPAVTGKPAGDDLREGKKTVLVMLAAGRAGEAQRQSLRGLGDPDLDDTGIERLRAMLRDTGALADVEERIETLAEQARTVLRSAPITEDARRVFAELVDVSTRRES